MKRTHELSSASRMGVVWPEEADDALLYALMQPWNRPTDSLASLGIDGAILVSSVRLVSRRWRALVDGRLLPGVGTLAAALASRLDDWAASKMCNLVKLDLRGQYEREPRMNTRLSGQGLRQLTRLRELQLGQQHAFRPWALLELTTLRTLGATYTYGAYDLAWSRMVWLNALELGQSHLGDGALSRLSRLTQLSLTGSAITGRALRQLPLLRDLALHGKYHDNITDDDLRTLTALTRLDLTNYNGAISIDSVATLPALTELVVEGWRGAWEIGGSRRVPPHVTVRRHGLARVNGCWKADL